MFLFAYLRGRRAPGIDTQRRLECRLQPFPVLDDGIDGTEKRVPQPRVLPARFRFRVFIQAVGAKVFETGKRRPRVLRAEKVVGGGDESLDVLRVVGQFLRSAQNLRSGQGLAQFAALRLPVGRQAKQGFGDRPRLRHQRFEIVFGPRQQQGAGTIAQLEHQFDQGFDAGQAISQQAPPSVVESVGLPAPPVLDRLVPERVVVVEHLGLEKPVAGQRVFLQRLLAKTVYRRYRCLIHGAQRILQALPLRRQRRLVERIPALF